MLIVACLPEHNSAACSIGFSGCRCKSVDLFDCVRPLRNLRLTTSLSARLRGGKDGCFPTESRGFTPCSFYLNLLSPFFFLHLLSIYIFFFSFELQDPALERKPWVETERKIFVGRLRLCLSTRKDKKTIIIRTKLCFPSRLRNFNLFSTPWYQNNRNRKKQYDPTRSGSSKFQMASRQLRLAEDDEKFPWVSITSRPSAVQPEKEPLPHFDGIKRRRTRLGV